ncbi:hypothetical protein SDC9_145912 [bioreactor metagenome]|uniref:Uncharacterized protein n=1 Tax=bioreactor metagenome TaxID=1076179 RepID=A0A645EDA8_9ZZZZ
MISQFNLLVDSRISSSVVDIKSISFISNVLWINEETETRAFLSDKSTRFDSL